MKARVNSNAYVRVLIDPGGLPTFLTSVRLLMSGQSDKIHRRLAIIHGDFPPVTDELRVAAENDDQIVLQVGDLAKANGKTVRAIHLYEDLNLLKPVQRSRGRFRLYNKDSIERVRWISKMQAVGFSLPELKQLFEEQSAAKTGVEASAVLRRAYVEKLRQVQGKLGELHRLE